MAKKTEDNGSAKKVKAGDSRRIKLLVDSNPKRGDSLKRFAVYRTGMTVGEYVAGVVALKDSKGKNFTRGKAMADITWDTDPKRKDGPFIQLSG